MIQQKVEIRFEKSEAIRFISHHDLMRALMRAVRRSGLPVRLTEGFNPRPRIVFPVALEVGVASQDEVAEIELTKCLATQEVFERLSSALPPGLVLKTVKDLPPRRMGQIPRLIRYRLHLREAEITINPEALKGLLAATTLPFQRPREKHLQSVDLRPALLDLRLEDGGDLLADVQPSQKGSARPLELLSLLLSPPSATQEAIAQLLESLKRVRVTKLLMEMTPPPELSEEAQKEREILQQREVNQLQQQQQQEAPGKTNPPESPSNPVPPQNHPDATLENSRAAQPQ
jgi:radical SAM-linked protein